MTLAATRPLLLSCVVLLSSAAAANEDQKTLDQDPSAILEEGPPIAPSEPAAGEDPRIQQLEDKLAELEARLEQKSEVRPMVNFRVSGYADVGFFSTFGNGGVGVIQDFGNERLPQYEGAFAWTFLGDLLAPTINSRGEASDLGDLPGVQRFDSVNSGGAPGFLVNEVNLTLSAGLSDSVLVTTSVNFVPRTGTEFTIGDFMEVDLAQLEWVPFKDGRTSIFIGKFDSVIGVEYRDRKATQRFGITPSLLHRYTSGTPLGIKARTKLFPGELITIAAALTNGSSTTEQFHFFEEVDTNLGKTASGRVSVKLPPLFGELELGVSGEYGAQDRATDNEGVLWFLGADMLYNLGPFALKGQWLRGMGDGRSDQAVYQLRLKSGAYLEANMMVTPTLGVLLRGEYRDAAVVLSDERLYLTKSWRATIGGRWVVLPNLVVKAEYLRNGEYADIPQIPNDVFTSSMLFSW